MGRSPLSEEKTELVKKGPWTPEEDRKLIEYVQLHGHRSWRSLPENAGLNRCGKSCRLRWNNYLRPGIKRGQFSDDEERQIVHLHSLLGNKWSKISSFLPGRTDNEIKNYWNTRLKKKLLRMGIDPVTHDQLPSLPNLNALLMQVANLQMLQNLVQLMTPNVPLPPEPCSAINPHLLPLNSLLEELIVRGPLDPSVIPESGRTSPINVTSYDMPISCSDAHQMVPEGNFEVAEGGLQKKDSVAAAPWQGLNLAEQEFSWKDILDQINSPNED